MHAYVHTLITLHYITIHYITIHYITLHYVTLHYVTLHYITLHYVTLRYVTLHTWHDMTWHYITLHYIHYIQTYIHTYIYICIYINYHILLKPPFAGSTGSTAHEAPQPSWALGLYLQSPSGYGHREWNPVGSGPLNHTRTHRYL